MGEIYGDYLWEQVRYTLPPETEVCVLGAQGSELYRSNPSLQPVAARIAEESRTAPSGKFAWKANGNEFLSSYWSLFLKPSFLAESWTVVVSQSKADAFGPLSKFTRTFVLILLVTLLAVSVLGSVLIRLSFVPLTKLKEGTRLISEGNFESRVTVTSGDEFQDLAVSFNEMSAQLGQQFEALTNMSQIVRTILTSLEKRKIVDAVISNLQNIIQCDVVTLSLVGNKADRPDQPVLDTTVRGENAASARHLTDISHQELLRLEHSGETIQVESCGEFPSTFSPLAECGAKVFYLFPVKIQRHLSGILILGYREQTKLIREDLIRARQIADQIAVALENAGLIEELAQLNWGTLTALARAVDANSPWTAGHSERVTEISLDIGRAMKLAPRALDLLNKGALLHDIGKIGVPEYILDKPGKLTDEEAAKISEHPEKGARILEPIPAYQEIIPIVAQHHEWFNGQGYPEGLAGEAIALGARIIAVADVYDALISDRPYRAGWDLDRVLGYIQEKAGSQFDPRVVDAFVESMGIARSRKPDSAGIEAPPIFLEPALQPVPPPSCRLPVSPL